LFFSLLLFLFPVALKTYNLKGINHNDDENFFDGYLIAILLNNAADNEDFPCVGQLLFGNVSRKLK